MRRSGARMGRAVRTAAMVATTLVVAMVAAACAPRVQERGADSVVPHLAADAAVMADGVRLPLRAWLPDAPPVAAVVALHGFNDYSNAYADLGPALAGRGIAAYAYDQRGFGAAPGHGIWAGEALMTEDFATVAGLVRARHPSIPVYGLGESMGGAVIMAALAGGRQPAIDGAVLSAPAVWGRATMSRLQVWSLDILSHVVGFVRLRPQGLNIHPSDNIEMLRKLSRDPLFISETRIDAIKGLVDLMDSALASAERLDARLLILYGAKDDIVPKVPTCRMLAALPVPAAGRRWRAAIYPSGYHMLFRDLAGDLVAGDIAAWLGDPERPLPSGHERTPEGPGGNPAPGFCDPPA